MFIEVNVCYQQGEDRLLLAWPLYKRLQEVKLLPEVGECHVPLLFGKASDCGKFVVVAGSVGVSYISIERRRWTVLDTGKAVSVP